MIKLVMFIRFYLLTFVLVFIYLPYHGVVYGQAPGETSSAGYLLVADKEKDTLFFINAQTLEIENSVAVGRGPHEVAVAPALGRAYVSNYEGGLSISIIDLNTHREWQRIRLRRHESPHGIVMSPDGLLYITVEANRAVLEMDPSNGEPLRTLQTNQRTTHMVVVSQDGRRLYTTNLGSGNVTVIDVDTGDIVQHIPTGNGTEGIALTPDGSELWITNRAADSISIIDTATLSIIETFEVTGFPIRVEISADGTRAVVSSAQAGVVTIIDVVSRNPLAQLEVGDFPVGIEITPDSSRAFVGNSRSGSVSVIDLQRLQVVDEINVGSGPDGMAFVPLLPPTGK